MTCQSFFFVSFYFGEQWSNMPKHALKSVVLWEATGFFGAQMGDRGGDWTPRLQVPTTEWNDGAATILTQQDIDPIRQLAQKDRQR